MVAPLSQEQRLALLQSSGQPVRVVDAESQCEYVLVRSADYQRLLALLGQDQDFAVSDMYGAQGLIADGAWADPADAEYDEYDQHLPTRPQG